MAHTESVFSGGGAHANAAIGRAVRLLLWNAGGATPGEPFKEVFGHPGRYAFCVAESPASPWPPLHQARGIDAASGITVFACESPTSVAMWGADDTPVNRLAQLAGRHGPIKGCNNTHTMGETLVVLTPNEARLMAEERLRPDRGTRATLATGPAAHRRPPLPRRSPVCVVAQLGGHRRSRHAGAGHRAARGHPRDGHRGRVHPLDGGVRPAGATWAATR